MRRQKITCKDDALGTIAEKGAPVYSEDEIATRMENIIDRACEEPYISVPRDMISTATFECHSPFSPRATVGTWGVTLEMRKDNHVTRQDNRVFEIVDGEPEGFVVAYNRTQDIEYLEDSTRHEMAHAEQWYSNGFTSEQRSGFVLLLEKLGVGHTRND